MTELLGALFSIEKDFTIDMNAQLAGLELLIQDEKKNCVLVAEYEKKIVGMCTVQLLISTSEGGYKALLEDVVVHSKYRRMGIGAGLLHMAEEWARSHHAKRMDLVAVHNNITAIEFYKGLGWKETQLIALQKKLAI